MKFHKVALLGLTVSLGSGCIAAVRTSSQAYVGEKQSQVVLNGTPDDAARRFTELFSKRGFQVTERLKRKDGSTVYVFKGQRAALTTVTGGRHYVSGSTNTVGSAFYVRLTPQEGTTQAAVFGKPTIDGRAVCSDGAPAWAPLCVEDVYTGMMWTGRDQVTGREEAEAIRGLLLELELTDSSGPGSAVASTDPQADAPAQPLCVASELPEWKTASAPEKKKLLEKCRAPGLTDEARAADSM